MTSVLLLLHLIAAAFWLGGLLFLGLLVVTGVRTLPRDQFRILLGRVGWYYAWGAVAAWLILAGTGVVLARQHLDSLGELSTTRFGQSLRDKIGWAAITVVAAVLHIVFGRSRSAGLIRVSRALGAVALAATLVVFYYATQLN